jgi:hypothetical protein
LKPLSYCNAVTDPTDTRYDNPSAEQCKYAWAFERPNYITYDFQAFLVLLRTFSVFSYCSVFLPCRGVKLMARSGDLHPPNSYEYTHDVTARC